jgi:hypothetical protein
MHCLWWVGMQKHGIDKQRCVDCFRPHHQTLTIEAELLSKSLDHIHFRRTDRTGRFPCSKQQRKLWILWHSKAEYSYSGQHNLIQRSCAADYRLCNIVLSGILRAASWCHFNQELTPYRPRLKFEIWERDVRGIINHLPAHSGRLSCSQYHLHIHKVTVVV